MRHSLTVPLTIAVPIVLVVSPLVVTYSRLEHFISTQCIVPVEMLSMTSKDEGLVALP